MNQVVGIADKFVTIITASNRPHNMRGFLDNLRETVDDYDAIEVLVKIDIGDEKMRLLLEDAVKQYPFEIRYINTDRLDGYYTLHFGYQQLLNMSNPSTYFIFPVNEEVRFKTPGWIGVLRKYRHFFPDDLFRLKISRLKYRNYYSFHECGPTPENYPFATRKWMELAGGIGDCWGPDGWHQCVDYHLGLTQGIDGTRGHFRSVPIHDILIGGEEAGKELTDSQLTYRSHRILQEWWRIFRTEAQQEFRKLATGMDAYIWAKSKNLENFVLVDDPEKKQFIVVNKASKKVYAEASYYLAPFTVRIQNFIFLVKNARRSSISFLKVFFLPSYGPQSGVKKWSDRTLRFVVVCIAIFVSFFVSCGESVPKKWAERFLIRLRKITAKVVKMKRWKKLVLLSGIISKAQNLLNGRS